MNPYRMLLNVYQLSEDELNYVMSSHMDHEVHVLTKVLDPKGGFFEISYDLLNNEFDIYLDSESKPYHLVESTTSLMVLEDYCIEYSIPLVHIRDMYTKALGLKYEEIYKRLI